MRSLHQRLEDHLTGITLPRVASHLGPDWTVQGHRLTGPRGEDFEFDLSWLFGSPRLLIYLDQELVEDDEDTTWTSVGATARPETIVEKLRAALLPACTPRLCPQAPGSDPAETPQRSEGQIENSLQATSA